MPLRLLLTVVALLSSAFALDLTQLKPQGYLSDFANVVDAESRQNIELYCARLEKATGAQMALVTIASIEGEPIENVANDLFRQWGIGKKGQDSGLLFLLVIQERRSRLEVGRGLEEFITDGRSGMVLRDMRPALRSGQYGRALWVAATSLGQHIAQAKGVQVDLGTPAARSRPQEPPTGIDIPWPLILGGLFLLLMIMGKGGPRRGGGIRSGGGFLPGLILGSLMNSRSGYGGYGQGGFGGYDSGDTFGGFGGGDSGGGGASSDW
jgi:uncharacterized protein